MDRAVAWLKRHVTEVWREKEEGTRGGGRSGGSKQGGRNEDDWSSDHDGDDDDDDVEEDEITATTTTTSNHKGEKKADNNGRKGAGDKTSSGGKDKDTNPASTLPLHDVLNLSTVSMANGTGSDSLIVIYILSFMHAFNYNHSFIEGPIYSFHSFIN